MQGEYLRKGPWFQEEDETLTRFVNHLGGRRWDSLAKVAGLRRSGKSCRLRWKNYLRPNLKHGPFSDEEKQLIIQLQQLWGNKWSRIACRLPGRTDNEIKNYWRNHLTKKTKVQQGDNHKLENSTQDFSQKSIDDMVSKDYNHENLKCQEHKWESNDSTIDTYPLSDWGYGSSPYEVRILDWTAELQNGYGEKELVKDSNITGINDYNSQGFSSGFDSWDYTVSSLWDMN
ncbi:PREDICTED: myb-related protein MYBAS1-like [Lupinus angustifolius]|uniref:myb-related protein MYBAS1-like n=1 Tax=Lupinus angustifolius TaxID=3871 RepID=UPI00092E62F3|nr:PREDICTED: myb-related protein MYBAS1-like [Lupinus angustifolius]